MELLIDFFNLILYQPLFNALVLLYQYLPPQDLGIAVIVLTLIIRLFLYPLMTQSLKAQKVLYQLQPKIQEIQRKYKKDIAKQSQLILELYRKEKINPFSGILPLLIQLPILIALYRLFWKGLEEKEMVYLYSFVPHPGTIDPTFLNLINLAQGSFFLAGLAGISQFFQTKMLPLPQSSKENSDNPMYKFSQILHKQMLYFFPVLTFLILWKLPSVLALFWLVTTLFSIAQQYVVLKNK